MQNSFGALKTKIASKISVYTLNRCTWTTKHHFSLWNGKLFGMERKKYGNHNGRISHWRMWAQHNNTREWTEKNQPAQKNGQWQKQAYSCVAARARKKCVLWMISMLVNVLDIFRQAPDIFEHRLNPNSSTIEIHTQTYKSLCSHEKYS